MPAKPIQILIANGVNLDLLGQRETTIYGSKNLLDLENHLEERKTIFEKIFSKKITITFFQSNKEGDFLNAISRKKWSGLVINPGAWTHTSLALADRLSGLNIPYVEVHLSNIYKREKIRQKSLIAPNAFGTVCGMGFLSYETGLYSLISMLISKDKQKNL